MTEDNLLQKLINEKFNGKEPNWREAKWGDVEVLCVGDKQNWYYKHDGVIYVQAKEGEENKKSYCYECGSLIRAKPQHCSVHFEEFVEMGVPAGGGEVRIKNIPFCPKCEKEPVETGIIVE